MTAVLQKSIPAPQTVAPLDIRVGEDGRLLVVILPDPALADWIVALIGDIGKIVANRQILTWTPTINRDRSFHHGEDIARYLQECWQEIHEEEQTLAVQPEPQPSASEPTAPRSGMRGLAEMADEMKMSEEELYRRLESREWDYKFKAYPKGKLVAGKVVVDGHEYLFDKRAATWNIKNKDNLKKME